jgi:tripartite-type tricarboxylate transporter receptor subunit TctC
MLSFSLRARAALYGAAACMTTLAALPAAAQSGTYPNRPIRWIVPLPPGGGADMVARTIGASLTKNLGQQVLVDNRAGGGTVIGTEVASRAAPDGYTWLLATATTHAINVSLVKKLPYDPAKDFTPVSLVAVLPQVFVVHPSLPVRSIKDLVTLARKRPGEVNFASTGNGSANQLAVEMLKAQANIDMVHIPYKGAGPSMADLLAGNVQFMSSTIPPAAPHFKTGRLIPLAVANAKRAALLPDVPTTAEAGAPGVEASSWNGLAVPAGTPQEIVARLNSEVVAVMKQPEVRERLLKSGVEPMYNTPAEFATFIEAETQRYAKVVKSAGVQVD